MAWAAVSVGRQMAREKRRTVGAAGPVAASDGVPAVRPGTRVNTRGTAAGTALLTKFPAADPTRVSIRFCTDTRVRTLISLMAWVAPCGGVLPLKCVRTTSSAGRNGSEMLARIAQASARARIITPGMQKLRAMLGGGGREDVGRGQRARAIFRSQPDFNCSHQKDDVSAARFGRHLLTLLMHVACHCNVIQDHASEG